MGKQPQANAAAAALLVAARPMRVRDQHRATLGASARKTGAPRPLTAAAAASSYAARGQAARAASERIAATMRNVPFQLYQVDSSGTRQRRLKMPAEVQGPEATKQVCDDDDRAVFCSCPEANAIPSAQMCVCVHARVVLVFPDSNGSLSWHPVHA